MPGTYWMFTPGLELEHCDIRGVAFAGGWADYLANQRPELAARWT